MAQLSMRSISLIECDKQQPTITTIQSLADALGVTMVELIVEVEKQQQLNDKQG